jgi:hypothetical protein
MAPISSYFTSVPKQLKVIKVGSVHVPDYAFEGLRQVQTIELSFATESIGVFAMADCEQVAKMVLPDTLKKIGDFAFKNCQSITAMTIPNTVESIGLGILSGCGRINELTLPMRQRYEGTTLQQYETTLGAMFGVFEYENSQLIEQRIDDKTKRGYYFPLALKNLHVTEGKANVGAFSGLSFLKEIIIDPLVGDIGAYAFEGCAALKTIRLNETTHKIGRSAFSGCVGLTQIETSDDLEVIEADAFKGCKKLKHVRLGKGLYGLDSTSFGECDQLEIIDIAEDNPVYKVAEGVLLNESTKTVVMNAAPTSNSLPNCVPSTGRTCSLTPRRQWTQAWA